jgi:REP element-mobilizing transposase RayT
MLYELHFFGGPDDGQTTFSFNPHYKLMNQSTKTVYEAAVRQPDFRSPLPLAYFLTWTCYGTWLHGDERASVDREHNIYGTDYLPPDGRRNRACVELMDQPPYELDEPRREAVLAAIRQHCDFRKWALHAVHVRSNHVHVVVSAPKEPERVLNDLKSYISRWLNQRGFDTRERKRWTRHGSTVYVWTGEGLAEKVNYVLNRQGKPMSVFEATTK